MTTTTRPSTPGQTGSTRAVSCADGPPWQLRRLQTVRIPGGPNDKAGETLAWDVELTLDETVGVLLEERSERNLGFLGLRTLPLFHLNENGKFTNGQLTFDPGDLARAVRGVFEQPGSIDCNALQPPPPQFPPQPTHGVDVPDPSGDGPTEDGPQLPPQITNIPDDPRPVQGPSNVSSTPE